MSNPAEPPAAPGWARVVLLLGCKRTWLDLTGTATVAVLLLWSRFSLLASGPWEWDETLFAHGLVKFSLSAHFPHPPGFPGWLALGKLLLPLAGDPLRALQWASATLSVLALWPLAILGRRVAPPPVATAAALAVLFLPGVWLHAVRGFSSTAATTVALLAAALAVHGLGGRRLTLFTLLVTCAFLIRPILLPGLGLLWAGVVLGQRPLRRLLPGLAWSLALCTVATLVMVRAEGGWQKFVAAFTAHGSRHFSRLADNPGGWPQLGLVKGLGGPVWAVVLLAVAAAGLVIWGRRVSRRGALLWAVVLVAVTLQVVLLQNRTYTRYPVPVHLALAPLLAAAATVAPPLPAAAALLAVAGVAGFHAHPLLVEQHCQQLPGWQAVETGVEETRGRRMALVVEAPLYPYASYRLHTDGGGNLTGDPRLVLSPFAPEEWTGVFDRPYLVVTTRRGDYLAPLVGGERHWQGVSDRLQPFTQGRFLQASIIANPPLPVRGWWPVEHPANGEPFLWSTAGAELVLPPLPPATWLALDLRPAAGEAPLRIRADGRQAAVVDGRAGRTTVWLSPSQLAADTAHTLVFERDQVYRPGGADSRDLAVQLLGVRAIGPGLPWQGPLVTEADRRALRTTVEGAYNPERFGDHGPGCWLRSRARLHLPAAAGTLTLTLLAPRPLPPQTVVSVAGRQVAGPLQVGSRPQPVAIPITAADVRDGGVVVELASVPYVPAAAGGSSDQRDLGVVLQAVTFRPPPQQYRRWGWLEALDAPSRGAGD